jgi:WD40 repeat protein
MRANIDRQLVITGVDSVKFLNYGLMASGSLDKSIKLWETITFKNIATKYNAHSRGINSLKTILKSNKNYLISSSSDKTIKIWDTDLYLNISKLF